VTHHVSIFIAGSALKASYAIVADVSPSIVRGPSCGHNSKTKQDWYNEMKLLWNRKLASMILLPRLDPPQTPTGRYSGFKYDTIRCVFNMQWKADG